MQGSTNLDIVPEPSADDKNLPLHIEDDIEHDVSKGRVQLGATNEAAKQILEAGQGLEFSKEDSKRVVRMIDWHVLLPMCLLYLSQQMDKSAMGWSGTFDIQGDTGLHGTQYAWLTTCVYLAQLVFQPLSVYALSYFPLRWWILYNYTGWSLATILTPACTSFGGLLACRTLLGMFEASIQPANLFMSQIWWTRREQAHRTIAWEIANSLPGFVGPLIAYGIGHAPHKVLKPYQGIYLVIGCLSFIYMPFILWLLPNTPTDAKFLRHGNDRLIALDRMKENNTGTRSGKFLWKQCRECLIDPKTYIWFLMFVCVSAPSGGFSAFGGLVTKGFGFDSFTAILTGLPSPAITIIAMTVGSYLNNKLHMRFLVIAVICLFPIAGQASLISIPRDHPGALLGVQYIGNMSGSLQPLMLAWANLNSSGTTKRVITTSVFFIGNCVGNMIGPQLFLSREAPLYFTGLRACLSLYSSLCFLVLLQGAYLMYLNRKQERRRISLGLPAKLKDISIMSIEEAEVYKAELSRELAARGETEGELFSNAFDDLTDWDNPMFMYVI